MAWDDKAKQIVWVHVYYKYIFIIINISFAIRRLNKYILYGKDFLKARRPPKM